MLRSLAFSPSTAHADVVFEVVTDLEQLAAFGPAWDRLVFASARYRPQASYAYVASYLEHLRTPQQPWACIVARRAGQLVGVLPFLISPPRHARLGGVQLDAGTLEADLVVAPGEEATIPALVSWLGHAAPDWVALKLDDLQDGSPTVVHLRADPGSVVLVASGRSSYVTLPKTYDEYLARLTSHFRNNLQRQTRKLFGLPKVTVEHVKESEKCAACLDAFIAVESSGWKARNGNAVALRPERVAYYRAATKRLAAAGALEWALLRTDGKVIAAFLMEHVGRKLTIDKIAYDAELSQVAPGNVLLGLVIERAIESGDVDEVDFLTDHEWNRRWEASTRDTFDITIYRRSVRALVPGYAADVARRTWRGARS